MKAIIILVSFIGIFIFGLVGIAAGFEDITSNPIVPQINNLPSWLQPFLTYPVLGFDTLWMAHPALALSTSLGLFAMGAYVSLRSNLPPKDPENQVERFRQPTSISEHDCQLFKVPSPLGERFFVFYYHKVGDRVEPREVAYLAWDSELDCFQETRFDPVAQSGEYLCMQTSKDSLKKQAGKQLLGGVLGETGGSLVDEAGSTLEALAEEAGSAAGESAVAHAYPGKLTADIWISLTWIDAGERIFATIYLESNEYGKYAHWSEYPTETKGWVIHFRKFADFARLGDVGKRFAEDKYGSGSGRGHHSVPTVTTNTMQWSEKLRTGTRFARMDHDGILQDYYPDRRTSFLENPLRAGAVAAVIAALCTFGLASFSNAVAESVRDTEKETTLQMKPVWFLRVTTPSGGGLNVRSRPDSNSNPPLGSLPNGSLVVLCEKKGTWGRIVDPEQYTSGKEVLASGWVSLRYVEMFEIGSFISAEEYCQYND